MTIIVFNLSLIIVHISDSHVYNVPDVKMISVAQVL